METNTCPTCHSPIPANAPGGFCPACLLRDAEEPPSYGHSPPPLEEIAAAFPQWEVIELIGQGGMGFVYKVRQPSLDRIVALKILSPELGRDPAFAERFAREARTLGKLQHPKIVTIFEHGEKDGFFYLLMEYVDGVNLRQAMRAGRFSPEQALAIVPGICDALQAAHGQGIWHRDIKPENILLDREGRVKIADFGIARIVGDPQRNFTLTHTGGQLGSAAYMAPEQYEKPHSVDHRADIYSLGVVIYEMLTGELPLGRFPLPSQRAEVGKRIDEIVMRTLEKERELRQKSAEEVKTDVTSVAILSTEAAVETPQAPASRFSRTAIVGAIWAVFVLVVLTLLFSSEIVKGDYQDPPQWLKLLGMIVGAVGISAPFGTTILGWIAVSQIRRSAGSLHGLWLAVFDGLLFPLLGLDAGIVLLLHQLGIACGWWTQNYDDKSNAILIVSSLVAWIVADWLIIRSVLRAVHPTDGKQPQPARVNSPSSKPSEMHGWISAVLFLASFAGAALLLFNGHTIWKNDVARKWPVTEGRIVSSRTYLQDASRGKPGNAKVARAAVRYSYSVNGRSYESANVSFAGQIGGRKTPAAVDDAVKYPEGTKVRVAYNPANPAEAVIDISSDPYGWLALGLLLFASFPVWRMVNGPTAGEKTTAITPPPLNRGAIALGVMMIVILGTVLLLNRAKQSSAELQSAAIVGELKDHLSEWLSDRGISLDGVRFERAPGSDSRAFASYNGKKSQGGLEEVHGQVLLNFTAPNQWTLCGMGEFGGINADWRLKQNGWPDQWPGLSFDEFRRKVDEPTAVTREKPDEPKPISSEAVAAYRDFQEFLHSKQPREFADPDVSKKLHVLIIRFGESLHGTQAEPLWAKFQQTSLDQRRAFARNETSESQRLDREGRQIEKELQAMMEQAGAPKYPDVAAASSTQQASKAAVAPPTSLPDSGEAAARREAWQQIFPKALGSESAVEGRLEELGKSMNSKYLYPKPQYRAMCRVEVRLKKGNTEELLNEALGKFCTVLPVPGLNDQFDLVVTDPDPAQTSRFANYLAQHAEELLKEREIQGTVKILKPAERPEKPWMSEEVPALNAATPEQAMKTILKAAEERNARVFQNGFSKSYKATLKENGESLEQFGDFGKASFLSSKTLDATNAEVVVEANDGSQRRFTFWMILEDGEWKLNELGSKPSNE